MPCEKDCEVNRDLRKPDTEERHSKPDPDKIYSMHNGTIIGTIHPSGGNAIFFPNYCDGVYEPCEKDCEVNQDIRKPDTKERHSKPDPDKIYSMHDGAEIIPPYQAE